MSLLEPAERRAHHHVGMSIPAALTEQLKSITRPHVDSFDYFLDDAQGMQLSVASLPIMHIDADEANARPRIEYWIDDATIGKPSRSGADKASDTRLFPNECREGGGTYAAPLYVTVKYRVGGSDQPVQQVGFHFFFFFFFFFFCNYLPFAVLIYVRFLLHVYFYYFVCFYIFSFFYFKILLLHFLQVTRHWGDVPVMVKSSRCHLQWASPAEMVARKEEATEMGGTFIVNGNERIVRLLIVPRRNHVFTLIRPSFHNRGKDYTQFATTVRCARNDQSSQTINLHYLKTGSCNVRVTYRKAELFIPVYLLLRAFIDTTDAFIFKSITRQATATSSSSSPSSADNNQFLIDCAESIMLAGKANGVLGEYSLFIFASFFSFSLVLCYLSTHPLVTISRPRYSARPRRGAAVYRFAGAHAHAG